MVFVISLQVQKVSFLNKQEILITQVKVSKTIPIRQIHFMHLQQYDKNHCITMKE